jgi:transcriptional regulator with XRE-family HTH domain
MHRCTKYPHEMRKLRKKAILVKPRNKNGVSFRKFVLENNIDVKDIAEKCKVTRNSAKKWADGKQWPSYRYTLMIRINFGYNFHFPGLVELYDKEKKEMETKRKE